MSEKANRSTGPNPVRPKIMLGVMSFLLAFAVAEVFCRGLAKSRAVDPMAGEDRPVVYYQVDPERAPLADVADDEAFRIAIIGDSFTAGQAVQKPERYAGQLEQMLNLYRGLRPVKVGVFAKSGTSTCQQLHLLHQARMWKPDLVILGICLNDTEDVFKWQQIREWRKDMIPRRPGPFVAAILKRSAFLAFVHRWFALRAADRGYVRYYRHLYDPAYSGWRHFRIAIKQFRNTCASENVPLLAVILPLMSDPFEPGRYRFEFAHAAIRALLEELGVAHVDALEKFRGKNPVRMMAIPVIDPHPSEIAHRMIAESILDHLLSLGYLPNEYRPVETGLRGYFNMRWNRAGQLMDPDANPDPDAATCE